MKKKMEESKHQKKTSSICKDNRGLSTVEYIVLLVVIVVASMTLWNNIGGTLTEKLGNADSSLKTMGQQ